MIRVFLDANVYFAGFVSKEGASFLILDLARRKKLTLLASRLVLREADRNLRKKSSSATLKVFRRYLQNTKIHMIQIPDEKIFEPYAPYIHPKDLPVSAAAVESKADFFITLDKRHFLAPHVLSKVKKVKILTSADFIREVYLKGKI